MNKLTLILLDDIKNQFVDQIAKTIDNCVIEAMASGIDLHEMGMRTWFEQDGNTIKFNCNAFKTSDMFKDNQ